MQYSRLPIINSVWDKLYNKLILPNQNSPNIATININLKTHDIKQNYLCSVKNIFWTNILLFQKWCHVLGKQLMNFYNNQTKQTLPLFFKENEVKLTDNIYIILKINLINIFYCK